MFLKYTNGLTYMSAGSVISDSLNALFYASIPRAQDKAMPGVCLISQYIESYRLKTNSLCQIQASQLNSIREKAYQLDYADMLSGKLDYASEKYPSVNNIMQAFISLGYVKNASGIGYIKPNAAAIKYYIRQYRGIIVETTLTDQTYNAHDYLIDAVGTVINEDFSKGFIAFGYDSDFVYLQNSLGLYAGSLGFHKMPWDIALKLIVKCAVFRLDNPT